MQCGVTSNALQVEMHIHCSSWTETRAVRCTDLLGISSQVPDKVRVDLFQVSQSYSIDIRAAIG